MIYHIYCISLSYLAKLQMQFLQLWYTIFPILWIGFEYLIHFAKKWIRQVKSQVINCSDCVEVIYNIYKAEDYLLGLQGLKRPWVNPSPWINNSVQATCSIRALSKLHWETKPLILMSRYYGPWRILWVIVVHAGLLLTICPTVWMYPRQPCECN